MTINKFSWVNTSIPGLRPCPGTYHRYFDVPSIPYAKELDLDSVDSPTACYSIVDMSGFSSATVDGVLFTPYYNDQQSCVTWYLGSDGRAYYSFDNEKFNLCAESRAEFDTRISIEASLWFKLCDAVGYQAISPEKVKATKDKLTTEEALYVEYYLSKTKEELNDLPPWDDDE
ncbi:hypothetical protein PPL_04232 [Heterostelium album PN500]|uniref:Uncharacterized protein n=1 Tax=Heterostelium pallidum (strain ATCC 26659 / Pp 5 / PN500) TaxID=670386 RepID=D3B701_HETP5|nr:hypothetical protein PPL_04232 [Heterostelium album PN500]EFA82544.1 hypothetical protein PPL_04232 [Heterostelium album PN500]|eukprot:XP_020434661.1 hypothetical protein PPL_04232 [Heterostelium album PN500]